MRTPFHSAVTLLIFLLTVIGTYALAPSGLKIHVPRTRWSIPIYYCWIPWFSIGVLLILQAISPHEVAAALLGDHLLRPATVIATHLCLAYLAVSCEITGLYGWLALHIARRTRGKSPLLLLCGLVALSGVLSAATCADVSLVALTPVMVYAAAAAGWDTMSLAATHMGAASVSGMLVAVSGTPNILAAAAFKISFLRFLAWMVLPTSAAAAATLGLLYVLLHRQRLGSSRLDPSMGTLPYPDPGILLHDQIGAAFSSATLVVCLLALAVAPSLRWSPWAVAAVFATVAALYNLLALLGPLKATVGRRSVYERRKRLHVELAQQGLRRVVSDEDLADLLLSAAQHREASFTRLAAAAASRVGGPAAPPRTPHGAGPSRSGQLQPGPSSSGQLQPGPSSSGRHSSSGWGQSMRLSWSGTGGSAGTPAVSGGPSMASLPSAGGSTGSPVRQWFSQRWSSLRGWTAPSGGVGADLVEAAADAGANLSILGECGTASSGASAAGGSRAGRRSGVNVAAAAGRVGGGVGSHAPGGSSLSSSAVAARFTPAPTSARMSVELQHLLTRGTAAAPDALDWWAAAAQSAQELLRMRTPSGGLMVGPDAAAAADGVGPTAAYPGGHWGQAAWNGSGWSPSKPELLAAEGAAPGSHANAGALTKESAFAAPEAMRVPGWDGGVSNASAFSPRRGAFWMAAGDQSTAAPSAPDQQCQHPNPRLRPGSHTHARAHAHTQQAYRHQNDQQLQKPLPSPGRRVLANQLSYDASTSGKHHRAGGAASGPGCGEAGSGTAAATAADLRDTCASDNSDNWASGGNLPPSSSRWKRTASVNGLTSFGAFDVARSGCAAAGASRTAAVLGPGSRDVGDGFPGRAGNTPAPVSAAAAAAAGRSAPPSCHDSVPDGAGGRGAVLSYHDPTHVSDQCQRSTATSTGPGSGRAFQPGPRASKPGSPGEPDRLEGLGSASRMSDGCGAATAAAAVAAAAATATAKPGALPAGTPTVPSLGVGGPLLHPPDPPHWSQLHRRSSAPSLQRAPTTEPLLGPVPPSDSDVYGDDPPVDRRQTLPSTSGFEGLFGCWRAYGSEDGESAALLPSRRPGGGGGGATAATAASDDPCHALLPLAPGLTEPPLPLPPSSLQASPAALPSQRATGSPRPHESPLSPVAAAPGSADRGKDDSLRGVPFGYGFVDRLAGQPSGGPTSVSEATTANAAPATGSAGLYPHGTWLCGGLARMAARSPFARSANVAFDSSVSGGTSGGSGHGMYGGHGVGSLSRCSSLGGGSSAASCGQSRTRPPSLGFLLFGPNEVTFLGTFLALPWANALLLLGMFVLVEALQVHGWIASLTSVLNALLGLPEPPLNYSSSVSTVSHGFPALHTLPPPAAGAGAAAAVPSTASAVFAIGWISAGFATCMTGQTAMLLLARAMTLPEFLPGLVASGPRRGAQLALVVGANLAPALALSGSITALRWGLGLRQLGVRLRCCRYMVSGLLPAVLAGMAAALVVLWVQCQAWG